MDTYENRIMSTHDYTYCEYICGNCHQAVGANENHICSYGTAISDIFPPFYNSDEDKLDKIIKLLEEIKTLLNDH